MQFNKLVLGLTKNLKNTNTLNYYQRLYCSNASACTKETSKASSCGGVSTCSGDSANIVEHPTSKSFKIEQIYTSCLSEFAYYIESEGEAVVIDPLRDVDQYAEIAKRNNSKIKYILETHFHADFVSGHVDLANKTGAKIVYGPNAQAKYDIYVAKDNEEIKVGKIKIKVLHTPGHTMESTCYLLIDEEGKSCSIFTGDTLFLGEVGRPDLAVKGNLITKEDLAGLLYESLINKILPLPDDVVVYPGHGAGSACGKAIAKGSLDTLGNQKKTNYALQPLTKEEFVKIVSSDLPIPPSYFFKDAALNKEGYKSLDEILAKAKAYDVNEFKKEVENGAVILDCRDSQYFIECHIPGSVNVSLIQPFAIWAATLISFGSKVVIVADPECEREAIVRLARVGYDHTLGFLKGGIQAWKDANGKLEKTDQITPADFKAKFEQNVNIVDVRNPSEWALGIVKGAKLLSMGGMLQDHNKLDKNETYYLYCRSGVRSQAVYSMLKSKGYAKLWTIKGGIEALIPEGFPIVSPPQSV